MLRPIIGIQTCINSAQSFIEIPQGQQECYVTSEVALQSSQLLLSFLGYRNKLSSEWKTKREGKKTCDENCFEEAGKTFYWNMTVRATWGDVSGLREEVVSSVRESDNI